LILEYAQDEMLDHVLFVVVDQLNRGQKFITKEKDRMELATLNLKAGEKAMSLAAFISSASYLRAGIDLLCNDHWEMCYDLSLQLHNLYVEAEYCNGHFEEVGHAAGVVIKQARSFEDKLRIYATLMKSLAAQNKLHDTMQIGFDVLRELGVQCPSPLPDKSVAAREIMKTSMALKNKSKDEFLNYHEMNEGSMTAAMKFLQILLNSSFIAKQEYLPLIIDQMMQLTLHHGICKESCAALGYLSFLLCEFEDFKESYHTGHLAILLLEKLQSKELLPQVYLPYFSGAGSYIRGVKFTLDSLLHCYQVGMQTGDIENAMLSAYVYLSKSFIFGRSLAELRRETDSFMKQMINYKQMLTKDLTLAIRHAILSLGDDPSLVMCQSTQQKDLLQRAIENNNVVLGSVIYFFSGIEAYIFGEYETAANIVQRRKEMEKQMSRKVIENGMTDFFDGLIFIAMAHKTNDIKWSVEASNAASKLEHYVQNGIIGSDHKLLLLQSEFEKDSADAINKYESAIDLAKKNEFVHEQAVACERAADFLLRNGDERAAHYYGKAHNLYLQWGAQRKADHLIKSIPF